MLFKSDVRKARNPLANPWKRVHYHRSRESGREYLKAGKSGFAPWMAAAKVVTFNKRDQDEEQTVAVRVRGNSMGGSTG